MCCSRCQIYLDPAAKFCPECGAPAVALESVEKIQNTTFNKSGFKENLNKSEAYKKSKNKICNPKPYFYMVYGGLVIFVMFALMGLAAGNAEFFIVSAIGLGAIIMAQIYVYVFVYQFWRFVITEGKKVGLSFEVESPGKAVGYLFIPFYNIFVWTFRVFRDFPKAFNEVVEAKDYTVRMPLSPASNIPIWVIIGIIPFVNIITSIALILFENPDFITQGVNCINKFNIAEAAR